MAAACPARRSARTARPRAPAGATGATTAGCCAPTAATSRGASGCKRCHDTTASGCDECYFFYKMDAFGSCFLSGLKVNFAMLLAIASGGVLVVACLRVPGAARRLERQVLVRCLVAARGRLRAETEGPRGVLAGGTHGRRPDC
eukprot:SRR837773.17586.p4 GENE.SRR837773.17586~~SRR837773.17586.p4  ORF type:complete len:154 (+),score=14.01 SRR837773.17586:32-463(+)